MIVVRICFMLMAVLLVCPAGEAAELLLIEGEVAKNGIYDPSIEYDQNGVGWLVYSAVVNSSGFVHTHLAKSVDNGKTWTYVKRLNESVNDIVTLYNSTVQVSGVWRYEVPSFVHDQSDPDPAKRWKLFTYKYFCIYPYYPENRYFVYSWIAYRYASEPDGEWSDDVPYIGGILPIFPGVTVTHNINSLSGDLSDIFSYMEQSAFARDGNIYMALQAVNTSQQQKTILISSSDHGDSWDYCGVLLDDSNAAALGYKSLSAPSIVSEGSGLFLFSAPESSVVPPLRKGTYVFKFENIAAAALKKNAYGEPEVFRFIEPIDVSLYTQAGESDYDEHNTYGGILMPVVRDVVNYPDITFEIYSLKEKIDNISPFAPSGVNVK